MRMDDQTCRAVQRLAGAEDFTRLTAWLETMRQEHRSRLEKERNDVCFRQLQGETRVLSQILDAISNAIKHG